MLEPLLDRIANLERSNRRWKYTSAILAAALLGVSLSSVFLGVFGFRQVRLHAEQARAVEMQVALAEARVHAEQARALEMRARMEAALAAARAAQAEAARKQAELVLQRQNKD